MLRDKDSFGDAIARRFRTNSVRTHFAKTVSKDPIALTRIALPEPTGTWTDVPEPEAAYSVHLVLSPFPKMQTMIEGHRARLEPMRPGDICIFDLSLCPTVLIPDPATWLRVHLSQRTLDDLAYDRGQKSVAGLRQTFATNDPVLHALGVALKQKIRIYGGADTLFLDQVALSFHSHVAETYGQLAAEQPLRGGLAPWQFRRACNLMLSKLAEGVGVAELASECGLSASHFSRAFRRSAGIPAHRWLMNARIGHAKNLLVGTSLPLADIAAACGFTDQSHLSRVFMAFERRSPARWRHLRIH